MRSNACTTRTSLMLFSCCLLNLINAVAIMDAKMKPSGSLHLKLSISEVGRLMPIFNAGVGIVTHTGIPLMALLCDQLGIDRNYVEERIQTIFVNGRAVDNENKVILSANAVVALSAAMPGLVGATFRKQGLLAGFRKDISHTVSETMPTDQRTTVVTLKLFNLVAKELGADLLRQQVWVRGHLLRDLIIALYSSKGLEEGTIVWDEKVYSRDEIQDFKWPDGWVALHVTYSP